MAKTLLDLTDEKNEKDDPSDVEESHLSETHNLPDVSQKIFKLRCKKDPGVMRDIIFVANGHADAVERARKYCKKFKHRFVYVEDFMVRLEDLSE